MFPTTLLELLFSTLKPKYIMLPIVDHFKRGYQERAETREKEFYSQRSSDRQTTGFRGGGGNNSNGGGGSSFGAGGNNSNFRDTEPPRFSESDSANRRGRPPPQDDDRFDRGRGGGGGRGGRGRGGSQRPPSGGGYNRRGSFGDRERFDGDPRSNRQSKDQVERITIVCGLDINDLLTHLERVQNENQNPRALDGVIFEELDHASEKYPDAFRSGKALTALISGAARRRNVRMAYISWDWLNMKHRQGIISKNTYHYNSMITVAATARKPQQAMELMKEMSKDGIDKNEVT